MATSPDGDSPAADVQLAQVREQVRGLIEQSEKLVQRSLALECHLQDVVGLAAGAAEQARRGTRQGDGGLADAGDSPGDAFDAGAGAAGFDSGRGPTAKKPPLSGPAGQVGARVRARRLALGLSQGGLAERAGLHWSFVGQVERGQRNISLHNMIRLAEALDINPAQLVDAITFHS